MRVSAAAAAALLAVAAVLPRESSPEPASSGEARPSAPSAESATASVGDRALAMVGFIVDEFGSRPAGTEVEMRTARFLAEQFSAMGYAVELAPFTFSARASSGTSQNVIAWNPNEDPEAPLIILGGHYDSVPAGPGANDNGSGTATVLEVARELSAHPIDGVAVWYVAFGAEELGLFGSRNLVDTLSSRDRGRLRLMVSIDMMAVGDQPAFHGSEPWVTEAMARAWSQGYEPVRLPANFRRLSDHGPFLDVGLPAIMFHWVEDFCWHQSCDVAERVQYEALELMGAIAIDLVRLAAR